MPSEKQWKQQISIELKRYSIEIEESKKKSSNYLHKL